MSSTDWDEIKRLAADFQRAQLSSGVQRLSERNCIEIINTLIEQGCLEVIFTTDGKEYITPIHLVKEIKDELYVHGGRVSFAELAKILSVDYNVVADKATEIEKSSSGTRIINGELIDENYVHSLADEINEKLYQQGQISIGDLTTLYDLPNDFLLSVVEKQLGKRIFGQQDKSDSHIFFTEAFVQKNLSVVRGALTALTQPTPVSSILTKCNIHERLFFTLVDTLAEQKELSGVVSGRQGTNSMFVPTIYSKNQSEWVNNFYKQNGYLEYNALSRLGISDPQTFAKKHFPNENLLLLASCAVGPDLISRVEGAVDDVISSGSFINLANSLPTVLEDEDIGALLNEVLKRKSSSLSLQIFDSIYLFSEHYLNELIKLFDDSIKKKAKHCVESGEYLKLITSKQSAKIVEESKSDSRLDKKEERRKKAAGGKAGGGTQGRETKMKSTKKKYMKGKHTVDDSDEEVTSRKQTNNQKLELITVSEVKEVLDKVELLQEDKSDELIDELAQYLQPNLNKTALETASQEYELSMSSATSNRRKTHSELQDKLNSMVTSVRLFEKGFKQFTSSDIQDQLAKYLLKSLCTEITNEIFTYLGLEAGKQFEDGKELTPEDRVKVINSVAMNAKEPLLKLHKSLGNSIEEFLNCLEAAVGPGICDIMIKKADKKRERQDILNHRQQLIEQLNLTEDPALVLHLASLIIFQGVTQNIVHASGRFVSHILALLQPSLAADTFNSLQRYHDLVLKLLTSTDAEEKTRTQQLLHDEMSGVKEIAFNFKKTAEKSRLTSE